jgi:hypothetical protein
MRGIFAVAVLITVSALAPTSASAEKALNKTAFGACLCHFGYGSVCQQSVACDNEGGRCSGTCSPLANATFTNR